MGLVDRETLSLNMALILGALLLSIALLFVIIAAWTGTNLLFWKRRQARGAAEDHRRTHRPNGQPYPPVARGLCDGCNRVCEKVYHLPSGQRRCPACYEESLKEWS